MMFTSTFNKFTPIIKWCLLLSVYFFSIYCFAGDANKQVLGSSQFNLSKWSQTQSKEQATLKEGTFVGYSKNLQKYLGLNLSIDSYIYTNQSDNSIAWVVGFVSKLLKLNYHIDPKEQNEYLEVYTQYPVNNAIKVTGYAGTKNDGTNEYRDYAVGLAFSLNKSVEISTGFADRETEKQATYSNVFLNINGTF